MLRAATALAQQFLHLRRQRRTTFWRSPITPERASSKIAACGSVSTATMVIAPRQPAKWCTAPEMPTAMYKSGVTVLPVGPICKEWEHHPRSRGARLAPTSPPNALASSPSTSNPCGPFNPRPPATITRASSTRTCSEFSLRRSMPWMREDGAGAERIARQRALVSRDAAIRQLEEHLANGGARSGKHAARLSPQG